VIGPSHAEPAMTQLMLDPAILDKLASLNERVQLCYPDGRVAGDFVPRSRSEPASWKRPPVSDEELAQRKAEGGRSLAEIMADLEGRA
jgi:hypothetical protein